MSPEQVLLFFLMMLSGWLPPCHEGAADCRPDRFLLSVSSCTSSFGTSARIFTVTAFFSIEINKGVQSHFHFAWWSKLGCLSTVARALNGHSW